MDKLQWFKFTPTDWIMGKIQRTPEITQARFMRLVCLYWNKECVLSVDDAEIEIDKEHLDILLSKKILKVENELIRIEFLDEQYKDLRFELEGKSKSGIIGNLKRWHKVIYSKFITGKITFEEAVELAKASHTDNTPIVDPSQNIAEENRIEQSRKEDIESIDVATSIRDLNPVLKENKIEQRMAKFKDELRQYVGQYGKDMLTKFFDYWTEPNKSKTKFRMEMEKTWDTARRLSTWAENEGKFGKKEVKPKTCLGI